MVSFTNLQATWCMAYAGNQNLSFSLSTNNASSDVLKTFKEQRPSGGTMRLRKIVFISLKLIIHNLGPPGLRPLPHELLLHPQMWTRAIFYVKAGHSVDSFRKDWTQLEETFEELSSFWTALSKALDPEVYLPLQEQNSASASPNHLPLPLHVPSARCPRSSVTMEGEQGKGFHVMVTYCRPISQIH